MRSMQQLMVATLLISGQRTNQQRKLQNQWYFFHSPPYSEVIVSVSTIHRGISWWNRGRLLSNIYSLCVSVSLVLCYCLFRSHNSSKLNTIQWHGWQ